MINEETSKTDYSLEAKALTETLKEAYKNSLYLFTQQCLGYKDVNWETHGSIFKALEAPTKRKLIVVPRGSFKSTICCVSYPIWLLIRNPNERIFIDSEVFTNSSNFLREIKAHLESTNLTELFGTFKTSENWTAGSLTIAQRTKVYKESSITCGGVGTVKVGQHYSVIVGDDYNSPQNSETKENREKVIRHYRYNQSILEPEGTMVIVGTRYSEGDLIGHILKEEINLETGGLLR